MNIFFIIIIEKAFFCWYYYFFFLVIESVCICTLNYCLWCMLYKQLWWDIASISFLNCKSFSLQCEWDLYLKGLKPVACSFMKSYSLASCKWGKLIQLSLSRGRGLEVRHSKIYKCWTVKGSKDCIHSISWYTFNKKGCMMTPLLRT